jgi:lariat debranching enzyme
VRYYDNNSEAVAGDHKPSAATDTNESTTFVGMESNDGICPDPNATNMESLTDQMTRFLSLDKCLPKRRHLHVLHVEPSSTREANKGDTVDDEVSNRAWLEYDRTWLAIHRRTEDWSQRTHNRLQIPHDEFENHPINSDELRDAMNRLITAASARNNNQDANPMVIPQNFVQTVPPFDPCSRQQYEYGPPRRMVGNPQTDEFLEMMGMEHKLTVPYHNDVNVDTTLCRAPLSMPAPLQMPPPEDDNEIDLDDDAGEDLNIKGTICNAHASKWC